MNSGPAQPARRDAVGPNLAFPARSGTPSVRRPFQLGFLPTRSSPSQISNLQFQIPLSPSAFRLSFLTPVNIGSSAQCYRLTARQTPALLGHSPFLSALPRPHLKSHIPSSAFLPLPSRPRPANLRFQLRKNSPLTTRHQPLVWPHLQSQICNFPSPSQFHRFMIESGIFTIEKA